MVIQIRYDMRRIIHIDHVEVDERSKRGEGGAIVEIALFLGEGRG